MNRQVWIAIGCMVFIAPVQAASFDCGKATTEVEKLVCDTPVISMLDDYLHHVYLEDINKANEEQKKGLMAEQ